MKYKLYPNNGKKNNVIEQFLFNRGIADPSKYLSLDESVTNHYTLLDNIDNATELFTKTFKNKEKISILVDEDVDGYCSAAMMYNYIKSMDSDYPIDYILHEKKAHGLKGVDIPDDTKLLIVPDGGTNDTKQCKDLSDRGIKVIILDHHESECDNPYAIIVNNQMSARYPNKEFCGAGIVYKFLQSLDDYYWEELADNQLDLVALANISDVMDMRSEETKYYVDLGLKSINNKCFQALINAQEFSMKGLVTIHNVQYNITPVINGCIRIGSYEERDLLFRAFIKTDESFEYKKRATKDKPAEVIQESIYDRAARLSKNAKSRQDKMRDKALKEIVENIGDPKDNTDKVIIVDVTDIIPPSLTGVVSSRVTEYYNRPCLLLVRNEDRFGGSARNIDNSPIDSFKDIVNQTDILNGQGHANAFGILNFAVSDKDKANDKFNDMLKDVVYDSTFYVDDILDSEEVSVKDVIQFENTKYLIGQGIQDPMLAIENIRLNKNDISIFGKTEDTMSFYINDVKFIRFKCKDGDPLYDWINYAWLDNNSIVITIVGKPGINEHDGVRTPQITISDLEITENNTVEDDDDFVW